MGGGGGRQNFRPVCQVFSPCRNIFSNHTGRLPKFGWILTYLKISVEMAVTWVLPGAIQLFNLGCRWSIERSWEGQSTYHRPPRAIDFVSRSGVSSRPHFSSKKDKLSKALWYWLPIKGKKLCPPNLLTISLPSSKSTSSQPFKEQRIKWGSENWYTSINHNSSK